MNFRKPLPRRRVKISSSIFYCVIGIDLIGLRKKKAFILICFDNLIAFILGNWSWLEGACKIDELWFL